MFYVYVLKSLSHSNFYIGSSENPEKRLNKEHNMGKVRYTKGRRPWILVYKERYLTRSEARKRELFLKSGKGRKFLDKILTNE
ncbi:MAG: endonuclease [Candidatus Brennerbacteria bacterium CG11_big_fil_rev_8_21_14_0_20_43_10]|uniref:Endonuclease n=2 Tax=Candidatus Brenneribacteriota TaxID=1817902 RepID=A0A2H9N670_9BACT|nr:MAG: endonuclease [Candidatus Brennerbacteria bacterium CG23_combo_of_CG06-09_8_20_14_all_44_41]PIR26582.1 MAG: endonuclease [Candidatus Brennerbacteria bacterium CG11_big_fil_rev_8_21_14_0_20_43_10]PIX28851.1 MAG: endonuclease [Candidatus Brennerbacteria bacterium CG_4_8_14_3_um_filter_43_14]PJA19579.1 MAG: endonuclease [Candidatus Brennerbacteria bacterium CG_4_10_14_0_2_um_filter_43_14]